MLLPPELIERLDLAAEPATPPAVAPIVVCGAPEVPTSAGRTAPLWSATGADLDREIEQIYRALRTHGRAIVVTGLCDDSPDRVRWIRALIGDRRVVGCHLALPPLAVSVVAAAAGDAAVGLDTGATLVLLRRLAAQVSWFAWVAHPRRLGDPRPGRGGHARSVGSARPFGSVRPFGSRAGYLVRPAETGSAEAFVRWPVGRLTAEAGARLICAFGRRLPRAVALDFDHLVLHTDAVEVAAGETDKRYWGTERFACGVWLPTEPSDAAVRSAVDAAGLVVCPWCEQRTWHAICPHCNNWRSNR